MKIKSMPTVNKFLGVYRHEGVSHTIWRTFGFIYEHFIRNRLPASHAKTARLNGIPVPYPDAKILDDHIGLINYEGPLIRGMNESIQKGDSVLIVGGGFGVSTVVASELAGDEGKVTLFEASIEMVDNVRTALAMNAVENVDVSHAIVGEANQLYGEAGEPDVLLPASLPEADVVVLDCEGAECDILEGLTYSPDSVVVETHGMYGSPPEQVENHLHGIGHDVKYRIPMEEDRGLVILVSEQG